jgi:hypothetical protein
MPTIGRLTFTFLILCMLLSVPATAGTRYLAGSPELSAYISGVNEFSAGTEIQLPVVIENNGVNEYKFVQTSLVDRDDLPNTAKFLTAALSPGSAPIIVKSDSRMLGDLNGSRSVTAIFTVKIPSDAHSGTYDLPLVLNYTYLDTADQYSDTLEYRYKAENITLDIPFTIKSDVSIDVLSAEPEYLNAGTEGYLNLVIENTGSEDGEKALVEIIQSGDSPIVPMDDSVYIGDFPSGSTVSCRYKVSVSDSAEKQTYPVDVAVVYQDRHGDFVTSRSDTIGVPVGGKADFAIVSTPAEMNPGNKKRVDVEYKNTGGTTIFSAQSRISAVDPFTSNDDVAYIGDLKPNESRTVSYVLSVDRSATIKQYGLDSEIRYRDALDKTYISDTMKVKVDVTSPKGLTVVLANPIYLSIVAAALIAIAYLVYHFRKKR